MEIKEEKEEGSFSLGGQPFICLTSGHLLGTYCMLGGTVSAAGARGRVSKAPSGCAPHSPARLSVLVIPAPPSGCK